MNYRHIYHAGNFADVLKHIFLTRALIYLMRKEAPLRYFDTHAGAGLYKIDRDEAERTGEWSEGVGRMLAAAAPQSVQDLLAPWFEAAGLNSENARTLYPGSPVLAQRLLRRDDRLMLSELHPADAKMLTRAIGRDKRVKAINIDGYVALNAWAPPLERRGLVLIDPPFEAPDEFTRLLAALDSAWRKWPTGTYMIWYPRKDLPAVGRFKSDLVKTGVRRMLCIEQDVEDVAASQTLAGSGLVIVNPPFGLEDEARTILPFLTQTLARGPGASWRVDWLAGE